MATYTSEQKTQIAENFMDLLLHGVLGVPDEINVDYAKNRVSISAIPPQGWRHHRIYADALRDKPVTLLKLVELIEVCAKHAPTQQEKDAVAVHLPALRFFTTLYEKKGLEGIGDWLERNFPGNEGPKKLTFDKQEMQCLKNSIPGRQEKAVCYSRRQFLSALAFGSATAAVLVANDEKNKVKSALYDAYHNDGYGPKTGYRDPSTLGNSRREFVTGARSDIKGTNGIRSTGVTALDLHPGLPAPPGMYDEDIGLELKGKMFHFYPRAWGGNNAIKKSGNDVGNDYLLMHRTVQPLAVWLAVGALITGGYHSFQQAYLDEQTKLEAIEITKSISGVFPAITGILNQQAQQQDR